MPETAIADAVAPSVAATDEGLNSLSTIFEKVDAPVVEPPKEAKKAAVAPAKPVVEPEKPKTPTDKVEPVKAPEKPVVAPANEIEDFEKTLKPGSRERFNVLTTQKAEKMFEEFKKTLPQTKADDLPEYKAVTEERDRLQKELIKYNVENDPAYKAKFVDKPNELRASLTTILDTYGIEQGAFFKALSNPTDKASRVQMNTMLEEVGIVDRVEAADAVRQLIGIQKEQALVQNDSQTALKVLQEENTRRNREYATRLISSRQAALDPIINNLQAEAAAFFTGEDGEKQKIEIEANLRKANTLDLEALRPEDRVKMLTNAYLAAPLNAKLVSVTAERDELRAKLDKYEKGAPGIGGPANIPGKVEEETPDLVTAAFGKR